MFERGREHVCVCLREKEKERERERENRGEEVVLLSDICCRLTQANRNLIRSRNSVGNSYFFEQRGYNKIEKKNA